MELTQHKIGHGVACHNIHFCVIRYGHSKGASEPSDDATNFFQLLAADSARFAQRNADTRMEPASLTKLMTSYAVFKALKEGRLKLTDSITAGTGTA